jgi:hypothetical protein
MSTAYVKQGDAGSKIRATLYGGDGQPADLTGASVRFLMRAPGATSLKVSGTATVESAAAGVVSYTWQAQDLDTPGTYDAEWEVTYAGGAVQTFPSDRYLRIVVLDDLD